MFLPERSGERAGGEIPPSTYEWGVTGVLQVKEEDNICSLLSSPTHYVIRWYEKAMFCIYLGAILAYMALLS